LSIGAIYTNAEIRIKFFGILFDSKVKMWLFSAGKTVNKKPENL
jgi:hypothetical protein